MSLDRDEEIVVEIAKVIRTTKHLNGDDDDDNNNLRVQLQFILSNGNCYFGDVKTIEDCFNERNVDDGVVFYKKLVRGPDEIFHYWLGYFGGNPTGYLLSSSGPPSNTGDDIRWSVLIENCDTDFIWRALGESPKIFIRRVKMAVYGDKYFEED